MQAFATAIVLTNKYPKIFWSRSVGKKHHPLNVRLLLSNCQKRSICCHLQSIHNHNALLVWNAVHPVGSLQNKNFCPTLLDNQNPSTCWPAIDQLSKMYCNLIHRCPTNLLLPDITTIFQGQAFIAVAVFQPQPSGAE